MSLGVVTLPLFQILPKAMDTMIAPLCDDKTVLQMVKVCKAWKRNPALRIRQDNYWGTKEGFPLNLLAVFQRCGLSIRNLPELSFDAVKEDFRQRIVRNRLAGRSDFDGIAGGILPGGIPCLNTDYVDFLNTRHLSAPIMRFKHKGRAGLVMCLRDQASGDIGICTIFRRFTSKEYWVNASIQHIDRTISPVRSNEQNHVVFDSLIPVLSGADPSIRLIDPLPAPPLPPISLPPPVSPAAPCLINRILSCLYRALCDFFFWLYRLCHLH